MEVFTQTEPLNSKISTRMDKTLYEVSTQTDVALEYQSCSTCGEEAADFFCPICQDDEKCILVLPACKHKLHTHCAPPWFGQQKKDTCPICREPQPPSFVQSFQIPAAISAERIRMETLRQHVRAIVDNFTVENTPLETERNVRSALNRLEAISRLISTAEERTTVQNLRDNLWAVLPSNNNLLTGNELAVSGDAMSENDQTPSESSSSDDEWLPETPILATEERTVTTRSIVDERTHHVIDNLNIALASDRDHYGIERALRVSLQQLSRVERLDMDRQNRLEIQLLRRNLIDMLPSNQPQTQIRPNELSYFERAMAVQDPPPAVMPTQPTRVVWRRGEEGGAGMEFESETMELEPPVRRIPVRRTIRQVARNPFVPRDTPVRPILVARRRNESGEPSPVRRRLSVNESDEIRIVDVRSLADRN